MRNNTKYILGAILVIIGILTISGNIELLSFSWL